MSTQLELKEKYASRGGVRVGLFIPFPEVRRLFPRETSCIVPAHRFVADQLKNATSGGLRVKQKQAHLSRRHPGINQPRP
jgi:hypothetical protein